MPKTILFIDLPVTGHLFPKLEIAKTLKTQNLNVYYISTDKFKTIIEDAGCKYLPYPNQEKFILGLQSYKGDYNTYFRISKELIDYCYLIFEDLIDLVQSVKPDLIVYDSFAIWAKLVSNYLKIESISITATPVINFETQILMPEVLGEFGKMFFYNMNNFKNLMEEFQLFLKKYGFSNQNLIQLFLNTKTTNLVLTTPEFHPGSKLLKSNYKFVGPIAAKLATKIVTPTRKYSNTVYVVLSTFMMGNTTNLFQAFRDIDAEFIIGTGNKDLVLSDIPQNCRVYDFVSQPEILKESDLFITNAGMNGVNQALKAGVPMICLPLVHEQNLTATRVSQLGLGYNVSNRQSEDAGKLKSIIVKALNDVKMHQRSKNFAKHFDKYDGVNMAVTEMLKLIN